jgi:SAM-dependent methyltransferase
MRDAREPFSTVDLEYIRNRYQERIAGHGVTFDSMNSGSLDKQQIRHSVHASIIPLERGDVRVLDLGCGLGQFLSFLRVKGFQGVYTGIDIVPEYVEHCRREFPTDRFELRNVFAEGLAERYDFIVASQVFNARYPRGDNMETLKMFLALGMDHCGHGLSVDMLSSYVEFEKPDLYYFSPEVVFSHAKKLTRLVRLRHDYLAFEFAVQMFRAT